MSLRIFHLVFLALAIAGADFVGGWALHDFTQSGSVANAILGIVTLVGGFGLLAYGIWFVRKTERAGIH